LFKDGSASTSLASNDVSTLVFFNEDDFWVSAFCTGQVFVDSGRASAGRCAIGKFLDVYVPYCPAHRYRPQVKVSSRLFNTSLNASLLLDLAVKYEIIEPKSNPMWWDAEISRRHVANQNRESVVASEDEMLIESNMKM
jgi:hypothetical protein